MSKTKQTISLEFSQEDFLVNLKVSDNFNTEDTIFEELAFYLGALEYNHQKDSPILSPKIQPQLSGFKLVC